MKERKEEKKHQKKPSEILVTAVEHLLLGLVSLVQGNFFGMLNQSGMGESELSLIIVIIIMRWCLLQFFFFLFFP